MFAEQNAEVAELADAQASGACGSNTVRVQVPPSAFFFICNCSEPSRFSCKSVNHACMNEHFYMEIYLADTPHRRNAQHFGGGSEQLLYLLYSA